MNHDLQLENTFAEEFPTLTHEVSPSEFPEPRVLLWNEELGDALGLTAFSKQDQIWVGNAFLPGARPVAMAYSGHQFGAFSPRLGDGRAWLMGEVLDEYGVRNDIHLKGVGLTPFSRPQTDGRAVLGPVLREYLMGEAMQALGVPTTRGLAVAMTGEEVFRSGMKPGAVLTRMASSHLRVGTFQFAALTRDFDLIKKLADYAIERHYPECAEQENPYLAFLFAVIERQAELIAKWMGVGFVHGVMNTDNMSISGETIDYGPCAFMEYFDLSTVFSSIDAQGRYAYGNQPAIAQWNLARFAEAILPLLHENQDEALALAERAMSDFGESYYVHWQRVLSRKLGMQKPDEILFKELNVLLQKSKVDFTLFFRNLPHEKEFLSLFDNSKDAKNWRDNWLSHQPDFELMNQTNPIFIPRNQKVEEAIFEAENNLDLRPFHKLLSLVRSPFQDVENCDDYKTPADKNFGQHVTYCGT